MKKNFGSSILVALIASVALAVGMAACAVPMKKIDAITINGTQYDIVTFGSWPQTIKAANVEVSEQCESKTAGAFTYYKGSDGEWYAKLSGMYCKVEPIKWRVLTTNYNGTGKKLLLAENILIGKRYNARKNIYKNSEIRKWLNSNANSDEVSDYSGSGGFLKTAFTDAEIAKIADTNLDNSARSTNPDADAKKWNDGKNQYASDTSTTDKIFLLSEQEVTKSEYGFDAWDAYKDDGTHNKSTRIRVTTHFARISGAGQSSTAGYGGWWWLRSPAYNYDIDAHYVSESGSARYIEMVYSPAGVVPALCVE